MTKRLTHSPRFASIVVVVTPPSSHLRYALPLPSPTSLNDETPKDDDTIEFIRTVLQLHQKILNQNLQEAKMALTHAYSHLWLMPVERRRRRNRVCKMSYFAISILSFNSVTNTSVFFKSSRVLPGREEESEGQ
jgi:hypothetical protein